MYLIFLMASPLKIKMGEVKLFFFIFVTFKCKLDSNSRDYTRYVTSSTKKEQIS